MAIIWALRTKPLVLRDRALRRRASAERHVEISYYLTNFAICPFGRATPPAPVGTNATLLYFSRSSTFHVLPSSREACDPVPTSRPHSRLIGGGCPSPTKYAATAAPTTSPILGAGSPERLPSV